MIASSSNPRVKQAARWQASARERREAGIFLAEGFHMYGEAPEERLQEVYVTQEALEHTRALPALREKLERTGYELVAPEAFRRMSDTQSPQGILCVVRRPAYRLEQLLEAQDPLFVVLEDLQDPGNLGTILRTAEGAGADGVILSDRTADVYHPKTVRATQGSIYRVPFVCTADLGGAMAQLRERGVAVYAAHLAGKDYCEYSYRRGTAFLIGNEGAGLSAGLAELADFSVRIPMEGRLESLNAAVSAALLMYEVHRQRFMG